VELLDVEVTLVTGVPVVVAVEAQDLLVVEAMPWVAMVGVMGWCMIM